MLTQRPRAVQRRGDPTSNLALDRISSICTLDCTKRGAVKQMSLGEDSPQFSPVHGCERASTRIYRVALGKSARRTVEYACALCSSCALYLRASARSRFAPPVSIAGQSRVEEEPGCCRRSLKGWPTSLSDLSRASTAFRERSNGPRHLRARSLGK
jgi:hypothetical protein